MLDQVDRIVEELDAAMRELATRCAASRSAAGSFTQNPRQPRPRRRQGHDHVRRRPTDPPQEQLITPHSCGRAGAPFLAHAVRSTVPNPTPSPFSGAQPCVRLLSPPGTGAPAPPTRPTGAEFRALRWLFRHPLFAAAPPCSPSRCSGSARRGGRTWSPAAGGCWRCGGGPTRPPSTGGPPPGSAPLAALDGLPRPALGRAARRVRAHPRPPPHRQRPRPPRAAGPGGHPVDRHPARADGPRPGPADLDRPHPRPRRRAGRRTGSPSPAAAPACWPWSSSGACPFTAPSPPPPSPSRPPRSTCRGWRSGTTSTAAPSCCACAASTSSSSARPGRASPA